MHVVYLPEDVNYWIEFYKASISNNQQYQLGGILPGFRGYAAYHHGRCIGSIFKSLYRLMLPMLKTVGKQTLISGSRVAADVAAGRDFKSSLKRHGKEAIAKLKLDVEWEVGLTDIIYMYSWFNLNASNHENVIQVQLINVSGRTHLHDSIVVHPSHYDNIGKLITAINKVIKSRDFYKKDEFGYEEATRKVIIMVDPNHVQYVIPSTRLHDILGVRYAGEGDKQSDDEPFICRGIHPPDLSSRLETLYTYCNIIENQIVGNTFVPLLRIVDVHGQNGDIVNKIYDNPHYVPVLLAQGYQFYRN